MKKVSCPSPCWSNGVGRACDLHCHRPARPRTPVTAQPAIVHGLGTNTSKTTPAWWCFFYTWLTDLLTYSHGFVDGSSNIYTFWTLDNDKFLVFWLAINGQTKPRESVIIHFWATKYIYFNPGYEKNTYSKHSRASPTWQTFNFPERSKYKNLLSVF